MVKYYENPGDLAMEAEELELELAFERYKQSFLIDGKIGTKRKIRTLLERARSTSDPAANLAPARSRIRSSLVEFCSMLA